MPVPNLKYWTQSEKSNLLYRLLDRYFPKKEKSKAKIYSKCNETPLEVFIDVLINKNYHRLAKEGKATEKELEAAWQKLWYEYCDLTGSAEYRQLFSLIKEAGYLENKLMVIRLACQNIYYSNDNSCINLLHNYGYRYKFDRSDPDKFTEDVNRVIEKSKTIELLISTTQTQIENIGKKSKDEALKEEWFDDYLLNLSKYMGFRIDRKSVTVMEFIRLKKMYELEIERLKNPPKKA